MEIKPARSKARGSAIVDRQRRKLIKLIAPAPPAPSHRRGFSAPRWRPAAP